MPLTVLSLNCWNTSGPYERRRERIREWIDRLHPDLIGFQEILRGGSVDMLDDLAPDGYHTAFADAQPFWLDADQAFGNAVASRWPITDREVLRLPGEETDEQRVALSVTVDAPVGDVSFTCTHLNWKFHHGMIRERQVVPLCDLVLRRRPREGFPPVLVGDFNAEPDSTEIRYVKGLSAIDGRSAFFHDAWAVAGSDGDGMTWSNRNPYAAMALEPDRRIDYVFVGYAIRLGERYGVGTIESCTVVCDDERDGVWPSDHLGVFVQLRTEPLPKPEWATW